MCKRRACDWQKCHFVCISGQNLIKSASHKDGSQLVRVSIHILQIITSQDAGHARQGPCFRVLHRCSNNYVDNTAKRVTEGKQPCVCANLSWKLTYLYMKFFFMMLTADLRGWYLIEVDS